MSNSPVKNIFAVVGLAALLLTNASAPTVAQRVSMAPQPRPSPNTPDGNVPSGLKGPKVTGSDPKSLDLQNQAEVKADIEKLYALVYELREQMKQTDATNTLSLTVVKKAQAIEKLAKEIKDRSKR
jgi:hypothetical protein